MRVRRLLGCENNLMVETEGGNNIIILMVRQVSEKLEHYKGAEGDYIIETES